MATTPEISAAVKDASEKLEARETKARDLAHAKAELAALGRQRTALQARIVVLEAELVAAGAALEASLERLQVALPVGEEVSPLAEILDMTVAGFSARLGPTYADFHPVPETFPDVWVRPLAPIVVGTSGRKWFSEGLGVETKDEYDYASTEGQILSVRAGLGVDRFRPMQSDGGVVTIAPLPAGSTYSPDADFSYWTAADGITDADLGQCIAVARGHRLQYNAGLVLFESGWVRTCNTVTGHARFGGFKLPANKIPLSIAITTINQYALIGVHDRDTGKGEMCVVSLYGGGHLFHDWPVPHPGLLNAAIWDGAKILGYVDLGIQWPTKIGCCTENSPFGNRIEGDDGNAGGLSQWDLDDPARRAKFIAGNNGGWIPHWGHATVISKYENKAVFVDMTGLFTGVRNTYFTSDATYAETKTPEWPYTFEHTPAWTPTVTATVDVPKPMSVLVTELGNGYSAVGTESGTVYFFTRSGVANGSIYLGHNVTSLNYTKWHGGGTDYSFWAVSRGDRTVFKVSDMTPNAVIQKTLRDSRMIDPVFVEEADQHGIEQEEITIADFNGRQLLCYRGEALIFVSQGGAVIPVHDNAPFEGSPALATAGGGYPFEVSTHNVN